MYQSKHEYPQLYVMVTDNPIYLKTRMVIEDIDEAVEKFRMWLERNYK
jgi:hypothetical protein